MSELKQKARRRALAAVGVLGLAGGSVFSLGTAGTLGLLHADTGAPTPPPAVQRSLEHAGSMSEAFRYAAQRVLPSVVLIRTVASQPAVTMRGPGGQIDQLPPELRDHPLFRRFFEGMPDMDSLPRQSPRPPRTGMGSGVIIDEEGIILTNNHVVAGGSKVIVRLHDGREFEAVEVKTDPKTDLAVVRIEGAGELTAAEIGDSEELEIGDWVLAVGAPFGLRETVTAGIISAKARGLGITEREEFLQTDAAINPGNSGGPLVDLQGRVVGINTAISTTTGGYQGVGFAVPINLAKWVSHELITKGTVQRAFLGVGIQELTAEMSDQLGLETSDGTIVTEVQPNSAAAKAGLEPGDVIVGFDGKAIKSSRQLQSYVERAGIGTTHAIEIIRNGNRQTLEVTLSGSPSERSLASGPTANGDAAAEVESLGVEVRELNDEIAQRLNLRSTEGVVITSVEPNSPAAAAGLSEGMVIAKVGQKTVTSVSEFRDAIKNESLDDGILLLIRSPEGSRFIVVKK